MAIDLDKLAVSANRPGKNAIVSRSWLRQVLAELTEARAHPLPAHLGEIPLSDIAVTVAGERSPTLTHGAIALGMVEQIQRRTQKGLR